MLTGQAKTDYQREYMRTYRWRKRYGGAVESKGVVFDGVDDVVRPPNTMGPMKVYNTNGEVFEFYATSLVLDPVRPEDVKPESNPDIPGLKIDALDPNASATPRLDGAGEIIPDYW